MSGGGGLSGGGCVAGRRGVRVAALGGRASVYSGQRILCVWSDAGATARESGCGACTHALSTDLSMRTLCAAELRLCCEPCCYVECLARRAISWGGRLLLRSRPN